MPPSFLYNRQMASMVVSCRAVFNVVVDCVPEDCKLVHCMQNMFYEPAHNRQEGQTFPWRHACSRKRFRTRRIKPRFQDFNLVTKYRCERAAPVRPPAASERCPNGSTHAPQTPCVSARSENVICAGRQASRHPACGCRNARARTNLASHLSCDARWVRSVAQHAALSRQPISAHTSCACRSFTALPSSVPSEPQVLVS